MAGGQRAADGEGRERQQGGAGQIPGLAGLSSSSKQRRRVMGLVLCVAWRREPLLGLKTVARYDPAERDSRLETRD
jgi:hypothetical protein